MFGAPLQISSEAARWRSLQLHLRSNPYRGKLIAIEGIDGAGKTTLVTHLCEHLVQRGNEVFMAKAPSDELRQHTAWHDWHHTPELRPTIDEFGLAIMALGDRLVCQSRLVVPALMAGRIVVFDRYILSALVYWATPFHRALLERLLAPSLGIYLDVEPAVAANRIAASRSESLGLGDLTRMAKHRRRYTRLIQHYGYAKLDAGRSSTEVLKNTISLLDRLLR